MSMTEQFFSVEYTDRENVFQDLSIWKEEAYRRLQGTYPVISLSFARIKGICFDDARKQICQIIKELYNKHDYLLASDCMNDAEKNQYLKISAEMENYLSAGSLRALSDYLMRYYKKKVIILLDEYDTPLQEAYVNGYWEELVNFMRGIFNASFKTNPYLEKALMTGITRVSKESIFSDLNNLEVITTTSEKYEDSFGFTEEEVKIALIEYGLIDKQEDVMAWYDGFTFGKKTDIYNPWSIINFLKKQKLSAYWANTSSNSLVSKLIREGSRDVKIIMEDLLSGKSMHAQIDEQVVFSQLDYDGNAVWSLLLASGYLKLENYTIDAETGTEEFELALTNKEVRIMFRRMIEGWFARFVPEYNEFIKAMLQEDLEAMNAYMNRVSASTFSYFDTGKSALGEPEPERFYHGFVLGLMTDLAGRYRITSNRESGFGRYDVMLEPLNDKDTAFILEFKTCNPNTKKTLEDTVEEALKQIEDKNYTANLIAAGIEPERIQKYGFAFEGKRVLIG